MGTVEYFESILHVPSCTNKYTRTKVNVFKITTQQMHYSSPNKSFFAALGNYFAHLAWS